MTNPTNTVSSFLTVAQENISRYAARSYAQNEFLASASLAISETPSLRKCLENKQGKESLYAALKYAAVTGLSLNPTEGKAALIPYAGKVQYQIMKNGLIELAMSSGAVKFITSDTVRKHDEFKLTKMPEGDSYEFSPALTGRGEIIGFFSAVKLKTGDTHVSYMSDEEVKDHRDRYSSMFKANPGSSPWSKSYEGMGLKTVIKRLFRNVNISPEIDAAIGADDQSEAFEVIPEEPGYSGDDVKKKLEHKPKTEDKAPVVAPAGDGKPSGSLL